MPWIVKRTAPQERDAYWGRLGSWVVNGHPRGSRQPSTGIPPSVARYEDYDVASDMATWLRKNHPTVRGEVIAVMPEPEPAACRI